MLQGIIIPWNLAKQSLQVKPFFFSQLLVATLTFSPKHEGATEAGAEVRVKSIEDTNFTEDVLVWADAIVLGSPTFYGNPAGKLLTWVEVLPLPPPPPPHTNTNYHPPPTTQPRISFYNVDLILGRMDSFLE
jgi:hypothetical protein